MGGSFKKFISIVCVLSLLIGLVPSSAFAAPDRAAEERAAEAVSGTVKTESGEPAAERSGGFSPKTSEVGGENNWQILQTAITSAADGDTIALDDLLHLSDKHVTAGSGDVVLHIDGDKSLTIDLQGYTIDRNLSEARSSGHVINVDVTSGYTVTIKGPGTITGGKNSSRCGGIFVTRGKLILSDGVKVTGNETALDGGGICSLSGGDLTVSGCEVTNNKAEDYGGGINVYGNLTLSNSMVTNNQARNGGGIYAHSSELDISRSWVSRNTASTDGGGIYSGGYCEINLTGSYVTDNMPYLNDGSGIYMTAYDTLALSRSLIRDDIYLPEGKTIQVGEVLEGDPSIYVTLQKLPAAHAPVEVATSEADCASKFVIENQPADTELVWENGKIILRTMTTEITTWAELQSALFRGGFEQQDGTFAIQLTQNITAESGDNALLFAYTKHPVTLDLNGYKINRALTSPTENGYVLRVNSGNLRITGNSGSIYGGNNGGDSGGGLYIKGGSVTLAGDVGIGSAYSQAPGEGNIAHYGAGVYVDDGASFTMEGGFIELNSGTIGSGVYVNGGSFTMNRGHISINTDQGGVVYAANGGQIVLVGGRIEQNILEGAPTNPSQIAFDPSSTVTLARSADDVSLTLSDFIRLSDGQFITITSPLVDGDTIHIAAGTPTSGQPVKIAESAQDCRDYLEIENQPANTKLSWENGEILLRDKSDITTWAELQEALEDGGTWVGEEPEDYYIIRLSNDVTATGTDSALTFSYVGHDVTLDLNGHTINRNLSAAAAADNGNVLTVESGVLILSDSVGGGSITGGNNTASGGGVVVNGGKLFADVGITGNKSQYDGGGVYVSGGSFTLEGGSVTDNTAKYDGGGIAVDSGSVTLLSGNINNNTARDNSKGINLSSNGALTLSGSSASIVTDNIYLPRNKTITVYGSPAAGSEIHVWSQDMPLIGDPVTIAVAAQEWTEYFAVSNKPENAELIWTENKIILQTKPEVTSWGDLQKALTAGGTLERQGTEDYYIVRLANDVAPGDNESALEFNYTGHDVILDLNGHKIDRNLKNFDQNGNVLNVYGGELILRDSVGGGQITGGFGHECGGVYIDEGTLTMEGGSITGNQAVAYGGIYVDNGGALNLKGGNISGNTTYSTQTRGRGIYVNSNAVLTLFNGSAITVTDSAYLPGGNIIRVSSTPADGSDILVALDRDPTIGNPVIIANSETDCAANFRVENQPANTSIIWENGQVKLITEGVKSWAALQAALNAGGTETPDGFIIQLGGDVGAEPDDQCLTFDYRNHPVILDLNGHTINRNLSVPTEFGYVLTVYSGELTLRDSKGGGQITGGNNSSYGAGGVNLYGGIFTMEGGSITGNAKQGSNGHGGGVYMDGGTFNLKGGSITGNTTSNTLGGGVYVDGGTFTVSGSPTVTGNGDSNIYLTEPMTIGTEGLAAGASLGVGAAFAGPFVPPMTYTDAVSFFTADSGYRLFANKEMGYACIEPESHDPGEPKWAWEEDLSAATLSVVCKNCGDLIWSETGTVTIAYDAQAGKLQAVATATHDEQTYTETKDLTEFLILHEAVEPAIDEDGTYTSGTQAYYELTAGDKKYYYTEVDGHPGEPCDPSTLKLDNFVISATSQNNGIIEKYIGSFGTEKTEIDLPSRIVNTVDQSTQYVPLKMLGNSREAFYTLPTLTETPAPSPSPVEITDRGSITNVSAGAFAGLSNLTLTLNAEEPITIANGAFTGCDNVTIRVMDVSGLKEGLHDDATGKYTVKLIDGHHYEVTATTWAEDYSTAEITITCSTCGEEHKLPAQVTKTETATEDPKTHEKTYTLSIKAEGTFEEQTYTVELEKVPFFNVTVVSMTGTLRLPRARNTNNTGYENYAVFYVKQDMLDPLNPPAGAALNGLTDGSGTVYNADEKVQITSDTRFTASWRSTWARVQAALNMGGTVSVTLYSDITPAEEGDIYLHVPQGVTATLDLGGHRINRGLGAATADGYVIRVDGSLILNNGTVTGGNNTGDGGGIYVNTGCRLTTENVQIINNYTQTNGGGIYIVENAEVNLNGGTISACRAEAKGGGLYIGGDVPQPSNLLGVTTIIACAIVGCVALVGGGLYLNKGKLNIGSNTEIINNTNLEGDKFNNIDVADGMVSILEGAKDFVLGLPSIVAGGIAGLPTWAKFLLGVGVGAVCLLIFDSIKTDPGEEQRKQCDHSEKRGEVEWEEEKYSSADETVWCGQCNAFLGRYPLTVNKEVYSGTQVTHYWVEPQYARTNTTRDVQPFKLIKQANIPAGIDTTAAAGEFADQEELIAHDRHVGKNHGLGDSPWKFKEDARLEFDGWLYDNSKVTAVYFTGDKDDEEITVKVNWKLPYGYKANDSEDDPVSGDHPLKPDERTNPDYVASGTKETIKENKWTRSNYKFTTWKMPSSVKIEKVENEVKMYKLVYSYDDGAEKKAGDEITITLPTMLRAEWQSKWAELAANLEKDSHSVEMSENVSAIKDDKTIGVAENNSDTLDLKGKTLDGKSQSGVQHVFDVSGTLTVKDSTDEKNGVVTGGKTDKNGAGALVEKTGTLKLEGGSIKGNMTVYKENSDPGYGGGVYIDGDSEKSGSFEMSGGYVKDNNAYHSGGGVYITENGSFKMSGGKIIDNKGGYSESGQDHKGSADAKGGGVYVGGSFEVEGNVFIGYNKIGEEYNNVYLPKGKTITVSGKLDDNAEIHVSMEEPGVITKGLNAKGGDEARGKADNFVSDDDQYYVFINKDGEAELTDKPTFDKARLELGGKLIMRFYMKYPSYWYPANDKMVFTMNAMNDLEIPYSAHGEDEEGVYFACPVNAYQMADEITATYYHGSEKIAEKKYSVETYLKSLADSTEVSEATRDLAQATMDYGSYIQPYLAKENGWTVGTDYARMAPYHDEIQTGYNPARDFDFSFKRNKDNYSNFVKKTEFYLALDSDTVLNARVYLKDGTTQTLTGTANADVVEPWSRSGNSWVLSYGGLGANALDTKIRFTCSVNEGELPLFTMEVSPLSFVNIVLSKDATSPEEDLALHALYNYWAAAEEYSS